MRYFARMFCFIFIATTVLLAGCGRPQLDDQRKQDFRACIADYHQPQECADAVDQVYGHYKDERLP